MSTTIYPHVEVIDGRAWIEGRKVRVTEIVLDWLAYRWDAEQIQRQHPHLTMAEIHAAFVYYFDHKAELDRVILEELEAVDRIRAETQDVQLQARLQLNEEVLVSIPLYMDQHVPLPITDGLRNRGIDVLTANDDGYSDRPDLELLERVLRLRRIIFTQDADFLALARDHWTTGATFPTVIYGYQLRTTIGQAILDLELICQTLEAHETINQLIYLPL